MKSERAGQVGSQLAPTGDSVIDIRGLQFSYAPELGGQFVLSDIDLSVAEREIVCLVGASGCGKSTLLNIIAGFLHPTGGEVLVDGSPVAGPAAERAMVFQEDAVFPWYSVRRNVEYGLRLAGVDRRERRERADHLLNLVGLAEVAGAYPRELSGGMRKRCDMARTLALRPRVLLMDEPFAALDVLTKERMQAHFLELWADHEMTVLFVTHDLEEALVVGDRVAVLSAGAKPLKEIVEVPYAHPRDISLKERSDFQELRVSLTHTIRSDSSSEVSNVG